MASLLTELFHDIDRRAREIAQDLARLKGEVPGEVEAYCERMEQMAARVPGIIAKTLADPDLNSPAFAVNYFRNYKDVARLVQELENLPLLVLRRFSELDRRMTALVAKICDEINYPFQPPVCSSISSQYYWTVAGMDLLFVPCLEPDHLLGLPDIYHELGHIILFREENRFVFPGLQLVDQHFDRLVTDGKKGNWPKQSIDQLEMFRHCWRQTWLIEFAADLIATYTAGPVFGWCNIRTSTNLGGELYSGNVSHPADDARATIIGLMLERMGEPQAVADVGSRWSELLLLSGEAQPHRYDVAYPEPLLQDLANLFYVQCEDVGLALWMNTGGEPLSVRGVIDAAWLEFRQRPESFGHFEREQLRRLGTLLGFGPTI